MAESLPPDLPLRISKGEKFYSWKELKDHLNIYEKKVKQLFVIDNCKKLTSHPI